MGKHYKKDISVNYKACTTGNHTKKADQLLQKTGLEGKNGVTKKKIADKLANMMKSYKNINSDSKEI